MTNIINARITGTTLGVEDHGVLSCQIYLDLAGGGSQGFGGYSLDAPRWAPNALQAKGKFLGRFGTAYGMEFIRRVLETVGVERWEDLKGAHVRVRKAGWCDPITAIGHLLNEKWFDPKALAEEYKEAGAER